MRPDNADYRAALEQVIGAPSAARDRSPGADAS